MTHKLYVMNVLMLFSISSLYAMDRASLSSAAGLVTVAQTSQADKGQEYVLQQLMQKVMTNDAKDFQTLLKLVKKEDREAVKTRLWNYSKMKISVYEEQENSCMRCVKSKPTAIVSGVMIPTGLISLFAGVGSGIFADVGMSVFLPLIIGGIFGTSVGSRVLHHSVSMKRQEEVLYRNQALIQQYTVPSKVKENDVIVMIPEIAVSTDDSEMV